jgi:hypothetical protein
LKLQQKCEISAFPKFHRKIQQKPLLSRISTFGLNAGLSGDIHSDKVAQESSQNRIQFSSYQGNNDYWFTQKRNKDCIFHYLILYLA